MQLLTEMNYTYVKVDLNTYMKLFDSLYFDNDLRVDK